MKKLTLLEAQATPGLLFKIKAKGRKIIELMMANAGNTQMQVNSMDAVICPSNIKQRDKFQRLLVIGSENGNDTISLMPGQRRTWILQTVCMDRLKDVPDGKTEYMVSNEAPNKRLTKAAAEWRKQRLNLIQNQLPPEKKRDQDWVQQVAWGYNIS